MTHLIITPTQEHTASTDEEIIQVIIHLLGRGVNQMAVMKDATASPLATSEIIDECKKSK